MCTTSTPCSASADNWRTDRAVVVRRRDCRSGSGVARNTRRPRLVQGLVQPLVRSIDGRLAPRCQVIDTMAQRRADFPIPALRRLDAISNCCARALLTSGFPRRWLSPKPRASWPSPASDSDIPKPTPPRSDIAWRLSFTEMTSPIESFPPAERIDREWVGSARIRSM